MSRIGKKVLAIPAGVEVKIDAGSLSVKGPKGTLARTLPKEVTMKVDAGTLTASYADASGAGEISAPIWGTVSAHAANMIKGVTAGFTKKLILEGIGYKSEVKGEDLVMSLGFSHPVNVKIPKEIKVTAEKNIITITGIDKDMVGQFAAGVRALKKPEPYKGKGMRYDGEVILRKEGKKTV